MSKLNVTLLFGYILQILILTQSVAVLQDEFASEDKARVVILPERDVFYVPVSKDITNLKSLTCKTEGALPKLFGALRWSGPNREDNSDELEKRHIIDDSDETAVLLSFVNPTPADSGRYYCRGAYQGNLRNASILVEVESPLEIIDCATRQIIIENRPDQKIICKISGRPPIVGLTKQDKKIKDYGNRYRWDSNENSMHINGLVNASLDGGRYAARAYSAGTGDLRMIYIDVEVHSEPNIAPFTGTGPEFVGIEGERALLFCNVSGTPKPLVYWYDPKLRNLTSEGGYHVNPEAGTLLIDKVDKFTDDGQFRCEAVNSVDKKSRFVTMSVLTKPQITAFENKTVNENDEVTLECRATGEPKPSFSIRKSGMNQQPYMIGDSLTRDVDDKIEEAGRLVFIHRIKIVATRASAGIHYCNATNKAGTAERVGHLHVQYKPDLRHTPISQYVHKGKKVALTCHITAYPPPTVTWSMNGVQINNPETNVKTDGQTYTITMSPPNFQQNAYSKYTCRAENMMGYSEQTITPLFSAPPGLVNVAIVEHKPTTVKLRLSVQNDGGDRIKYFKYTASGRTLDIHNPAYSYRIDLHNETVMDASLTTSDYIIRNLLPYYSYTISIRAVNDMGPGEQTEIHVDTRKPERPDPPMIVRPATSAAQHSTHPSDYRNGYVLQWNPPELDNGGPVTKYLIKISKIDTNALPMDDFVLERTYEQMSERPMHARLGPLEVNQKYRIAIQARNNYGDSDPAYIFVHTTPDKQIMQEYELQTMAWIIEPTTPTLIALISSAAVFLILIDLIFCFSCQIGVSHLIRKRCFPSKTTKVSSDQSDKTYA